MCEALTLTIVYTVARPVWCNLSPSILHVSISEGPDVVGTSSYQVSRRFVALINSLLIACHIGAGIGDKLRLSQLTIKGSQETRSV